MKFFNFDGMFLKLITEEANNIAEAARKNASWSTRIPNAISVGTAEIIGDGKYSIAVIVDATPDKDWKNPNPNSAPEAVAFEYGSGIHGKKGQTYIIKPINAPVLAFDWPGHDPDFPMGKKFVGISDTTGKFLFNYVDHPGVAARPFLKPAIDANKKRIKSKLISVFKRGFLDSIKGQFRDFSA